METPTPTETRRSDSVTLAVLVSEVRALKGSVEKVAIQSEEHRAALARVETSLAIGTERMAALTLKDQAIDDHLKATDGRVDAIEADKRGPLGIIGSIAAGAAAIYAIIKGS